MPRFTSVAVTLTPGIRAPAGSCTVPLMRESACPKRLTAANVKVRNARHVCENNADVIILPPFSRAHDIYGAAIAREFYGLGYMRRHGAVNSIYVRCRICLFDQIGMHTTAPA